MTTVNPGESTNMGQEWERMTPVEVRQVLERTYRYKKAEVEHALTQENMKGCTLGEGLDARERALMHTVIYMFSDIFDVPGRVRKVVEAKFSLKWYLMTQKGYR